VLARNPNYREVFYDENPPADDARLQAAAARYKGKRLPLLDEVHIAIIEEQQPRWLSFLNEEQDLMEELPPEFTPTAIPNNQLAPNLAKKGIQMVRYPRADVAVSYFGMEHPVVGGYEPHKVACAAPSAWRWTWTARSASCGAARRFRRRVCRAPSTLATTQPSRAR
jgi:hypothetical protein